MKYGLIGKSLVHSYSKEIHEALGKYTYELFSLSPEEMPEFISRRDFQGLNVTIPYKKDVMTLCDEISPRAEAIGAVNTLYWSEGRLIGHNTDYEGFLYAAARAGIDFKNKAVLILGSGGTSLMAQKAVSDKGASRIFKASRKPSSVSQPADADADAVKLISYDGLSEISDQIDVIVNTTPVGTFPNNMQSVISLADFKNCEAVIDVIYNPFRTKLLLEAENLGLKYSNGLPMLVAQATAAASYFLGTPGAFEQKNEKIIAQLEAQMRNIIIIGMPGCGKSTIGKLLAGQTGKTFIDMDDEIVRAAGISIPEIFEREGEAGFRDRESAVAEELGKQRGLVIATGGGTVLRQENIAFLRQNGLILHVERPVSRLPMSGRPLSKDTDTLKEMEKQRMPVYRAAADVTFDNSKLRNKKALAAILKDSLKL